MHLYHYEIIIKVAAVIYIDRCERLIIKLDMQRRLTLFH